MSGLRRFGCVALLAGALAGCGMLPPPPDTATLPPGAFGTNTDNDTTALAFASAAFGDPARTYGRPVDAARAVAGLDYMAGEINTSPRWMQISPTTQMEMLRARVILRKTLGIAPNAPSTVVVNGLLQGAQALLEGDTARARQILGPPVFAPDTIERLSNLPYMREVNVAATHAEDEATGSFMDGGDR